MKTDLNTVSILIGAFSTSLLVISWFLRKWANERETFEGWAKKNLVLKKDCETTHADVSNDLGDGDRTFGAVLDGVNFLVQGNAVLVRAVVRICQSMPEVDCQDVEDYAHRLNDRLFGVGGNKGRRKI